MIVSQSGTVTQSRMTWVAQPRLDVVTNELGRDVQILTQCVSPRPAAVAGRCRPHVTVQHWAASQSGVRTPRGDRLDQATSAVQAASLPIAQTAREGWCARRAFSSLAARHVLCLVMTPSLVPTRSYPDDALLPHRYPERGARVPRCECSPAGVQDSRYPRSQSAHRDE